MSKKEESRAGIQKVFENYREKDEDPKFVDNIKHSLTVFDKKESKKEEHEKKESIQKKENIDNPEKKIPILLDILLTVTTLVALLFMFRMFIFTPFNVDGQSMEGNLHHGEFIYVDKLLPRFTGYDRGDVIVTYPPTDSRVDEKGLICIYDTVKNIVLFEGKENPCNVRATYVKRIIGVPGDIIEITGGQVFITPQTGEKKQVSNSFLTEENKNNTCVPAQCNPLSKEKIFMYGPVPENKLFVLGDNRSHSSDSRATTWETAFVDQNEVIGIARAVFLSPPIQDSMTSQSIPEKLMTIPEYFKGIRRIISEEIITP